MDGIENITRRDTISPIIQFFPSEETIIRNSGHVDLEYCLLDENLINAWYFFGEGVVKKMFYDDSMYLDDGPEQLVYAFKPTGDLGFKLKNDTYELTIEAEDLFFNRAQKKLHITVNVPPPNIFIHLPLIDSPYTDDDPE